MKTVEYWNKKYNNQHGNICRQTGRSLTGDGLSISDCPDGIIQVHPQVICFKNNKFIIHRWDGPAMLQNPYNGYQYRKWWCFNGRCVAQYDVCKSKYTGFLAIWATENNIDLDNVSFDDINLMKMIFGDFK